MSRPRGYMYPPEGQGFYNPFMPGPDIAGGINMLTAIIAQRQAQERAQEQEAWEKGITEERLGLERRRTRLAEEQAMAPKPMTQWDFKQNYTSYMASTGQWTPEEAAAYLATNQVPEKPTVLPEAISKDILSFHNMKQEEWVKLKPAEQAKFLQDYFTRAAPKAEPQIPAGVKGFSTALQEGINRYQKRMDTLAAPPTTSELEMALMTGQDLSAATQQKSAARENLVSAKNELIRILTEMREANKMPSAEDRKLATMLLQSLERAEAQGTFWLEEDADKDARELVEEMKRRGIPITIDEARRIVKEER